MVLGCACVFLLQISHGHTIVLHGHMINAHQDNFICSSSLVQAISHMYSDLVQSTKGVSNLPFTWPPAQ